MPEVRPLLSALDRRARRFYRRLLAAVPLADPPVFDLTPRRIEDLFPGIDDVRVQVPASEALYRHVYALPLQEYLLVGALTQLIQPQRIFEIGTYAGSTTLLMAENTPVDCRIFTLDLPPDRTPRVPASLRDASTPFVAGHAAMRSRGKVHQLHGDSAHFDFSPYYGTMDFVFIDADHSYASVDSDSRHAMKMIRSGGIILWDDYVYPPDHPECRGVSQWLHQSKLANVYSVHSTRFALHQAS